MKWEDVEDQLDKNKIYYMWNGKAQNQQDIFVLLTLTRLFILKWTDQGWQYSAVHGYVGYEKGDVRPFIRYGLFPLYKIKSNNHSRYGYVRPGHKIHKSEDRDPADLKLAKRFKPHKNDPTGELTAHCGILKSLFDDGCIDKDHIVIPDFYLSRDQSAPIHDLFLAPDSDSQKLITEHPDYDPDKSLEQNIDNLKLTFARFAGKSKIALPWGNFYGKGVPVADPEIFFQWYTCDRDNELFKEDKGVKVNLGPFFQN